MNKLLWDEFFGLLCTPYPDLRPGDGEREARLDGLAVSDDRAKRDAVRSVAVRCRIIRRRQLRP